ncbi:MAG: GerMN domain-containing protein [Cryobacterium sp.]|nr:GerMN domain-containing protein [Cryobacterium sp.]
MTEAWRRVVAVATVVLVATTLAACGGIPTSGSVQAGDALTEQPTGDFVFNPLGPAKDADQRAILDGFIAAFTGPQGDYQVARQYLSSDFKKEWDPRQSVLIRTGSPTISQVDSTTMEYSFTPKAQLDEFGAYSVVGSTIQTLQFQFVKEKDQWRISQAPPGIVLPESTFLSIFSKHALYFYDLSLHNLVPDERWFPGGTTATRIVTALLVGPPEWMKGAVVSQFPDGTQLTPGTTVTLESTTAQVDLTSEAASADERQRQLMQLQLSESLVTVPGIASVEISVAGSLLAIKPIGADSPVTQRPIDSRPLVLAGSKFGYLSGGQVSVIPNLGNTIAGLKPRAVAVGEDATAAAVLTDDGVSVIRAGQADPRKVDARPGLIAPAIDDFGYIWSVPKNSPNAIQASDYDGAAEPVAVTLPAGASIVSLDIAQDNTRIAILLQTSVGPRLIVAAIIRDPSAGYRPTSIGPSVLDTLLDSDVAVDATWIDRFSVATLTNSDNVSTVGSFEIGGQPVSLGRPATTAVAIVGGNGKTGLRVLGIDHLLESPRGSSWQATSIKVDLIATQR